MLKRLSYRVSAALERRFPEQRLFLKSDTETRFIRLTPAVQAAGTVGGALPPPLRAASRFAPLKVPKPVASS